MSDIDCASCRIEVLNLLINIVCSLSSGKLIYAMCGLIHIDILYEGKQTSDYVLNY